LALETSGEGFALAPPAASEVRTFATEVPVFLGGGAAFHR